MTAFTAQAPRVSVIMPAYNAERYLEQAVASVRAQTITDWELLILDDASTDSTAAVAEACAASDVRIRFYRNEQNLGSAATRNRALTLARGPWIAFLDSDDLWRADKLERQLLLAQQSGAPLVYSAYTMFTDDGRKSLYSVPARVDYEALLRENVIGCSTVLLRRDALGDHRFSPEFYHEDYALWLELLRSGCSAAGCTEPLMDWRVHANARSFNKQRAARSRWQIYRRAERLPLGKSLRVFTVYAARGARKVRGLQHAPDTNA